MTTPRDPDALLSAYLAIGMEVLPDRVVDSILDEVHRTRQRRVLWAPQTTRPLSRTTVAAAAVVAAIAVAGALFVIQRGLPEVAAPSPAPNTQPSPSLPAVVAPSAAPDATTPTAPAFPRTTGVWVATSPMGTSRYDHTAVRLLDGRVLVVGGDDKDASAELYDPATGTWSATGGMVRTRAGGTAFAPTLLRDGRVLIGDDQGAEVYDPDDGTWTVTETTALFDSEGPGWSEATMLRDGRVLVVHDGGGSEIYDPASGTWTATGELKPAVDIPTPVTLSDGKVLVAGGDDTSRDRAALYDPATGSWIPTGTMGTPRLEHLVVPLLDGRVLVVGGANDDQKDTSAELYDPASGTWTATGSMLRFHAGFAATLLDDGRVLIGDAGGAELYDPDSGTWTDAGTFTETRGSATLLLDGTVLLAGDSAALYVPAGVSPSPHVELDGGAWIATGSMGTPRSDHTAVRLIDGRVLVVGGGDGNDTSAELYDPVNGTWSATGSMLKPHSGGFDATLLRDGRVIVGDVDDPEADDPIEGAEIYDPASGTWTATELMARGGGLATLLSDGRVLVTGNDGAQVYDPATGIWTATGKMIDPRHSHAAILLSDGNVLVAGGHAPGDDPTAKAELYDPDTGAWTSIANMLAPREDIEAFLQPDGTVLVMGGSNRNDKLSIELYDPATGTWTESGDLPKFDSATLLADGTVLLAHDSFAARYDPVTGALTATAAMLRPHRTPPILLLDGTVLVAGGRDCLDAVCVATSSAELYVPAGVSPPPLPAFPSPPPPDFPDPTPSPTPVPPAVGPIPSGARTWKVTVMNRSSEPATLFVAEEDGSGILGRLVGAATPNVVPPGATVKVTFLVPAIGTGWAIFVNPPGPIGGPIVGPAEMSLPVRIMIMEDGQPAYSGGPFN